jgi:Coenzyme PQQ synthesis protein D (PqqD)
VGLRSHHFHFSDSGTYVWHRKEFHDRLASSEEFIRKTEDAMFRVSEYLRKTSSEDGGIVLDVKHGRMFGLNIVGSRILELLEQQHTPAQIAQEIAVTFGVTTDIADRDVREFLETLEKHHLIEMRLTSAAL